MSSKPLRVASLGMGWWSDVLADAVGRTDKDRDCRLLHALRRQARCLRQEIRLRAGGELRGNPGGRFHRGHHQHHAQPRAPRNHRSGGGSRASTFFSINPSPTPSRTERRSPKPAQRRAWCSPSATRGGGRTTSAGSGTGSMRANSAGSFRRNATSAGTGRDSSNSATGATSRTPCRAASCSRLASTTPTC